MEGVRSLSRALVYSSSDELDSFAGEFDVVSMSDISLEELLVFCTV